MLVPGQIPQAPGPVPSRTFSFAPSVGRPGARVPTAKFGSRVTPCSHPCLTLPARARGLALGPPGTTHFLNPTNRFWGAHQRCHLSVPIFLRPQYCFFFCLLFWGPSTCSTLTCPSNTHNLRPLRASVTSSLEWGINACPSCLPQQQLPKPSLKESGGWGL